MSSNRRNVGIFVFDDIEVLDFAGPFEVFGVSSELVSPSPFNTFTFALTEEPVVTKGSLSINPSFSINNLPTPDILILPGGDGRQHLMRDERVIELILSHFNNLDLLLSVCTGAFFIAHTGLLKGLQATTHHGAFSEFRNSFPDITLVEDKRYVESGKIITSGGVSAGIDMSLYVIQKLLGNRNLSVVLKELEWRNNFEPECPQ